MVKQPRIKERTVVTKSFKIIRRPSGYARENIPKRMKLRQLIDKIRGLGWEMPLFLSSNWRCYCLDCAESYMWID